MIPSQTVLVDPGKLKLNFVNSDPLSCSDARFIRHAKGVLTVRVRGSPPENKSDYAGDVMMINANSEPIPTPYRNA